MKSPILIFGLLVALPAISHSQQLPDAGSIQRDNQPPALQAPKPDPGLQLDSEPEPQTQPGGPQVQIDRVEFSGNTLLATETLQAAIADLLGRSLDLAGLRSLAQRVSDRYTAAGYPFTRAYLPPQDLQGGSLKIAVLEGRYGAISTDGEPRLATQSLPFLRDLRRGDPIESAPLERRLLLLADQPGVKVTPLIRSGAEEGTGDLLVTVSRTPLLNVDLGYDNHGSTFTGEHRARLNARFDSPFRLGDQVLLRGVSSTKNLWLGSLSYSVPVGTSGLRASLSHARTVYELGGNFRSLDASGTADISAAAVSLPLRRSPSANTAVAVTLENKTLRDRLGIIDSDERKSSRNLGFSLQFDRRDRSGVTYGSLGIVPGDLRLRGEAAAIDAASGRRAGGGFVKWTLDIARVQTLGQSGITVFGRMAAQRSDQNLDSSEKFSLGGPYAVRAYPIGEGNGDEGMLAQLELRGSAGRLTPFVFFDAAHAKLNAKVVSLLIKPAVNTRSLTGTGLGVRVNRGTLTADGVVAWRTRGGKPQAEDDDSSPRLWLNLSYRFPSR